MSRVIGKGRYATETYPEASRGGAAPAALLEPILIELWVGVMTTPPATPNGSIEAPFPTLQAAFDLVTALPVSANTKVTYFLNSGPGPAFSTTPALGHHNIIGLDERTEIGVLTVTPAAGATLTVSTRNVAGSIFIDGTTGHIFLTITNDAPGVGSFQAADISFGDSPGWGGTVDLVWVNGFVQQCLSPTSRARFYDCQFPAQGAVSCLAIDTCANCDINVNNTIQVFDVPNGLGFVGCDFHNGPVQFDGPPGSVVLDPQSGLTFNTATLLTSGATTNLAGDVGKVLTVVAPGLPRYMPTAGSANLPLQFAYWVATLDVPPATPDGTDEAPFERISQCLLAVGGTVPTGATITIFLVGSSTGFTNTQGGIDRSVTVIGMDERASVGNVGVQCSDAALGHDPVVLTVHNATMALVTVQSSTAGTDPTPFEYFHSSDSPINDCGQIDATGYVAADGTTPVTFPLVLNGSLFTQGASGKNAVLSMEGGGIVSTALDIDSVASIIGAEIISTDIAVQNVGAFRGLVACSFFGMAAHTWTGPADSFVADDLSATSFFRFGGTLAGGATLVSSENSGCNNGTNVITGQFARAWGGGHTVLGFGSVCMGFGCSTGNDTSLSWGNDCVSTNISDLCGGTACRVSANEAGAVGLGCSANAGQSFAFCFECRTEGVASFACGAGGVSYWPGSHVRGSASDDFSREQQQDVGMVASINAGASIPLADWVGGTSLPGQNGKAYVSRVEATMGRVGDPTVCGSYALRVCWNVVAGAATVASSVVESSDGALATITASAVGDALVLTLNGLAVDFVRCFANVRTGEVLT